MRVLLVGASGQLGRELNDELNNGKKDKDQIWAPSREVIDVTKSIDNIRGNIGTFRPDVVINCAAMHDLEKCEENPEEAFNINAYGQLKLARICGEHDITMIYISTNCVFDGKEMAKEITLPNPISAYGASKLAGEHFTTLYCRKPYIIRTSGIFGKYPPRGKSGNFVDMVINKLRGGEEFKAKVFENINPTYATALAQLIVSGFVNNCLNKPKGIPRYSVYHIVGKETVSWYEYAMMIADKAHLSMDKVKPVYSYTGDKPNIRMKIGAIWSIFLDNDMMDLSKCLDKYLDEKYGIRGI